MDLTLTVAPGDGHLADDRIIQGAIETVAAHGGGTVQLEPGTYTLHNSVRLRSGVRLLGSGEDTLLFKPASATVPIIEDSDWYDRHVVVADVSPFRVGGGVLLSGICPHYGSEQIQVFTITAIEGNRLWLDNLTNAAGHPIHLANLWIGKDPTATTIFSYVVGNWIHDVEVAHLRIDGNFDQNVYLSGNHAGGLYFQDCERVHLHHLHVSNVNSDGLSFQVAHDVTIEESTFDRCVQGIHAGSGSQRPIIRNNAIRNITSHGLAWCWGVKYGVAEGNVIEDCGSATSIGHRDTDNIMRGNTFRRCTTGLVYRDDPPHQAAHDNVVEGNLFEDIGNADTPGVGIDMSAPVHGNVVRHNRFRCTQPGLMTVGLRIGAKVESVALADNVFEGLPTEVEDLRT